MKRMPTHMHDMVVQALNDARLAHDLALRLIADPQGRAPESLEDALNALQDAGYRARRAFRVEEVKT